MIRLVSARSCWSWPHFGVSRSFPVIPEPVNSVDNGDRRPFRLHLVVESTEHSPAFAMEGVIRPEAVTPRTMWPGGWCTVSLRVPSGAVHRAPVVGGRQVAGRQASDPVPVGSSPTASTAFTLSTPTESASAQRESP